MIVGNRVQPCEQCPALVEGDYFAVADGETVIYRTPESFRIITVYAEDNVAGLSDTEISSSELRHDIAVCHNPETITKDIKRKGLAGLFGLRQEIQIVTCPATKAQKVSDVSNDHREG